MDGEQTQGTGVAQAPTIESQIATLQETVKGLQEEHYASAEFANALQNRVAALQASHEKLEANSDYLMRQLAAHEALLAQAGHPVPAEKLAEQEAAKE
jgi:two-component sensor histidine kinase